MLSSAVLLAGCTAGWHGGTGYPNSGNTGTIPGTTFLNVPGDVSSGTGWAYSATGSGSVQVTGNGAVLSGLSIPYALVIKANNVTVSNCLVVANLTAANVGVVLTRHDAGNNPISNVTIQDCEIRGQDSNANLAVVGVKDVNGDTTNLQIRRCNISWATTGIQLEQGLIQDCYIHDVNNPSGQSYHVNGITSNGGATSTLTIRHNTVFNPITQTDAISLFEDNGIQTNRFIDNNLMAGGGYALYAGQTGSSSGSFLATNISVTSNRFSNIYYATSGQFGPATGWNPDVSSTWSGNVYHETGITIPHP